jgi:hypothetical protein
VAGIRSILVVAVLGGCVAYAIAIHYHIDRSPAVRVQGAWIVVENQTNQPWRDVTVTVNAYYRGVSPTLSAGGRLEAPLASFVTGLGQRFNASRERVSRVEVRAVDGRGQPVALDFDGNTGKIVTPQTQVK